MVDDTGARVIKAIQRFSRSPAHGALMHELYRAQDRELTPAQVDALEILAARPEWRMNEFAAALDINPGAASRTAERLEKLGLAERRPDDADRRYVIARATDLGRRISRRIARDRYALMQEVTAGFADARRIALADMLEELTDAMEAALARRSPAAPAAPGPADPLAALHRWADAGGVWRVLTAGPQGTTVALYRCDAGEEIERLTSADPAFVAHVAAHPASDPA